MAMGRVMMMMMTLTISNDLLDVNFIGKCNNDDNNDNQ